MLKCTKYLSVDMDVAFSAVELVGRFDFELLGFVLAGCFPTQLLITVALCPLHFLYFSDSMMLLLWDPFSAKHLLIVYKHPVMS